MICEVCGSGYEADHVCGGTVATGVGAPGTVPKGFALGHYLRLAWRIVRWDDSAVREVMNDSRSLPYGILIWSGSIVLPALLLFGFVGLRSNRLPVTFPQFVGMVEFVLISAAIYGFVHMGICHLMAKYFCAGQGSFIQIIRPLLLAEIVYLLLVIPFVGWLVAAIAWVAVMVMVFQEVHGIEPLSAFLLSASVGVALKLMSHFVLHTPF
jgi:hypothetical protein